MSRKVTLLKNNERPTMTIINRYLSPIPSRTNKLFPVPCLPQPPFSIQTPVLNGPQAGASVTLVI